jgi:hypothetical protein
MKITAKSAEDFKVIESALKELDPEEEFLSHFKSAEQSDKDNSGITVILRNNKRFIKNLNKNKYIVVIPDGLEIDSFEYVTAYEGKARNRVPVSNVVMKCHMDTNEVNFVVVLSGFNTSAIRVIKALQTAPLIPPSTSDVVESVDDAINEAVADSTEGNVQEAIDDVLGE